MRVEGSKEHRSRSVPRPQPTFRAVSTKDFGIELPGLSQGKEQHNATGAIRRTKIQVWEGQLWCRGYYVDTVGKKESRIAEYIKNQPKEDKLGDPIKIPGIDPFTGSK